MDAPLRTFLATERGHDVVGELPPLGSLPPIREVPTGSGHPHLSGSEPDGSGQQALDILMVIAPGMTAQSGELQAGVCADPSDLLDVSSKPVGGQVARLPAQNPGVSASISSVIGHSIPSQP
jgi:hypothetical protein